MSYSADTFVADEQPTTAKWNKLWSNDASFNDGTGIADDVILSRHINDGNVLPNHLYAAASTNNNWTWDTWSPSLTGITLGNGSTEARYMKIGKLVAFRFLFTFGSTSSMTTGAFSPPVDVAATWDNLEPIGFCRYVDSSSSPNNGTGYIRVETATSIRPVVNTVSTYLREAGFSSTVPFTWATGDTLTCTGLYEAA